LIFYQPAGRQVLISCHGLAKRLNGIGIFLYLRPANDLYLSVSSYFSDTLLSMKKNDKQTFIILTILIGLLLIPTFFAAWSDEFSISFLH